jgi:POT family proton-dependent oligopeptide transporter
MLLGFLVFVLGKPLLQGKGEPPDPARLKKPLIGPVNLEWLIYLGALAGAVVIYFIVQRNDIVGYALAGGAVAMLSYLTWFMVAKCDKAQRERMLLALVLILASVVFWALYEQGGSSLNQFAERNTDLRIGFGQSMTPAQTQTFQAVWILIFAPVFAALWAWLGVRGRDPNPAAKFALGLMLVGGSYFMIVFGAGFAGPTFKTPLFFLAFAYLMQTTGELCLSPVGLSQMTKLAPAAVTSTLMATWFLGTSGAQWLAGRIAALTAADTVAGAVLDPGKGLHTYVEVFTKLGLGGVGAGLVMLALSPWLKRWLHGANDAHAQQPEPIAPVVDGERQAVNPQAIRADRAS